MRKRLSYFILALVGIAGIWITGIYKNIFDTDPDAIKCVYIHIRDGSSKITDIIYAVKATLDEMELSACGTETTWPSNAGTHLSVDFFTDSPIFGAKARELASKLRNRLPAEFQRIVATRQWRRTLKCKRKVEISWVYS